MKFVPFIFLLVLCLSCSTVNPQSTKQVALPKLDKEGVNFNDGLQKQEAAALASLYHSTFVSSCWSMPDEPKSYGRFWMVQLHGGLGGTDYGKLLFAKDGSGVFLEPPEKGFGNDTKWLLTHNNISYE